MKSDENIPRVCCVIVTYGRRWKLCKRVCQAALAAGVTEVVIIDNGSTEESSNELRRYCSTLSSVFLVSNEENLGSSGGVCRGLRTAFRGNSKYIWILDDDTEPDEVALDNLITAHSFLINSNPEVVLYSSRLDTRPWDRFTSSYGQQKRYQPNNFCGYSFFVSLFSKIYRLSRPRGDEIRHPITKVHYGPYGGMFANKSTFQKIGFPDERFFVYADDHEYSNRFSTRNIPQFLIFSSRLIDIDTSAGYPSNPQSSNWYSEGNSVARLYYTIRNHTYLSKSFISCWPAYVFNMLCFLIHQCGKGTKDAIKSPARFSKVNLTIWRAISDGFRSKLGYNPLYQIDGHHVSSHPAQPDPEQDKQ